MLLQIIAYSIAGKSVCLEAEQDTSWKDSGTLSKIKQKIIKYKKDNKNKAK